MAITGLRSSSIAAATAAGWRSRHPGADCPNPERRRGELSVGVRTSGRTNDRATRHQGRAG